MELFPLGLIHELAKRLKFQHSFNNMSINFFFFQIDIDFEKRFI